LVKFGIYQESAQMKFTNVERTLAKEKPKDVSLLKDAKYVSDNQRALHAQVQRILEEVLGVQLLKHGLKWQLTIDGTLFP